MRHFNIPVFIPELACPFRCVYCNQFSMTGNGKAPDIDEVTSIIDTHLTTLHPGKGRIEVAFFGGSFTGLEWKMQLQYLDAVQPYLQEGRVEGIRLSTRPDYIAEKNLSRLKEMGVVAIELGAQSLDDEVLKRSGRGHTAEDVVNASGLIKLWGFELGLQMMTGLPGDSVEKSLQTAREIVKLKAETTRIYPTLVIRDTPLEDLFNKGLYAPQTIESAVDLSARLFEVFSHADVKILRMGLHPSEGFFTGESLVAGPFHPAFGELVLSKIWHHRLFHLLETRQERAITIVVNPSEINVAIGHKAGNKKFLLNHFNKVKFVASREVPKGEYHVDTY